MGFVSSYRDLDTYKLAREIAREIHELSKGFPREEQYSLTDQIRRSSRSVGAQIAKGWGKRRYEKHFISKLTDADAEQYETQHWLDTALECGYLETDGHKLQVEKCELLSQKLNAMIKKANQFCL